MAIVQVNKARPKSRKIKVCVPRLRYVGASSVGVQQQIQLKRCRVRLRKFKFQKPEVNAATTQSSVPKQQHGYKLRQLVVRLPRLFPSEAIGHLHPANANRKKNKRRQ